MKVAIVYDRVNKIGGAERVLESIRELFPDAILYTSVYNQAKTPWAEKFTIKTSFLQKIPFINSHHELIPYLMPMAFESFRFDEFDLVLSITSEASKGIIVGTGTRHICICLTPTRYLWSGYDEYFKNPVLRFLTKPLVYYLRRWDKIAATRPDMYIAISENVKKRIKKYYGCDSRLIYPPSDRLFKNKYKPVKKNEEDYFLVVSRLVDYKRIDLAVRACTRLKLKLIVIGEGSEYERLDSMAGPSVTFLGKVTDEELVSYYKNCKALIFPGEEDFGITMVEVQRAGRPVIAYAKGGALEIVKKGKTGVFFDRQTVASLSRVLINFRGSRYNNNNCIENAKKFSEARFKKELTRYLQLK